MTAANTEASVIAAKPPLFQPDRSEAETTETFRRLFALKRSFGPRPNKNDLAIALIGACILEGFDNFFRIQGAMRALGSKDGHILSILSGGTGDDPHHYSWRCDAKGRYSLHN